MYPGTRDLLIAVVIIAIIIISLKIILDEILSGKLKRTHDKLRRTNPEFAECFRWDEEGTEISEHHLPPNLAEN